MKFNFRKISAIAASALMTGMTMGVAAAANYPAPFVSGGVANAAVVYGTGDGVSRLDLVEANNIQNSLAKFVSGGSVVVEGGESFVLEKSSKKFHLGESLTTIYSSLDDGELKNFLADGTYKDGDVDEDYEQTITLSNKDLELFSDREYNNKEPTFGFVWNSGAKILEYKIKFDSEIPWGKIKETDFPIMDKTFYVISAKKGEMVILDSAEKVVLAEGDSVTVGGKTVSIEYIEQNAVKFNVDGQITKTLDDHDFAELSDGSYIVANDVMFASKESGISKVEFSIGAGQLTLSDGQEIESNKKAIDGLEVVFDDSATGLTALTLEWYADDKTFLTEENALTMPAPFDSIRLVFDGLDFPSSSEKITIEPGDTLTIDMGNYKLPFIWWNDSGAGSAHFGEDGYPLKLAPATNTTAYNSSTVDLTDGFDVKRYDRILVTLMDNDLSDIETGHFEVTKIDYTADNDFTVTIKDLISSDTITFENKLNESKEFGEIEINLVSVNGVGDGNAYFKFKKLAGTSIEHNVIVSETGLMVTLPTSLANITSTGVDIEFREQDKDGDVGQGSGAVNATVKADATDDVLYVASHTATPSFETEPKSKINIAYLESDLASKVTLDKSGTDNVLEIEYYGEEVPAKVMVVGGDATVSSGDINTKDILVVKDTEVSSVATRNLIVVGGSCINSAAAALVGGSKCGASWTEATGVGQGQFLIKGYADSTITTGFALLVAGYDVDDTVKASTYLTNKVVDTSKALKGTSSTLVAVEIEEA